MKRRQKTARKPLVISIHGQGIDIDATFSDSQLGDLIADTLRRAAKVTTPPIVESADPKHFSKDKGPRKGVGV